MASISLTDDGADATVKPAQTPQGESGAYAAWKRSKERETARKTSKRAQWAGIAFLLGGVVLAIASVDRKSSGDYRLHAVPLIGAALLAALGAGLIVVFCWVRYASTKREVMTDWRREETYRAIEAVDPEPVRRLIILNQRRMDQYHEMTLAQAADAWRSSQLAMIAGLVVLVVGGALAFGASNNAAKGIVGGLSTIGGALSAYVVATFLHTRSESLQQLNHYFQQPVTTSHLLTAERLVDQITDEGKDAALRDAVTRIVEHAFTNTPDGGQATTKS